MVPARAQFEAVVDDPRAYGAGYLPLAVSIFADRAALAAEMEEDAVAAGFRLQCRGTLGELLDSEARALGEAVLVDVPTIDGAKLAALARIDLRAAHSGAELVVSTSLAALDDVFGCLDQSGAQILVAPTRAERVIALGRVLAAVPRGRVRELTDADRVTLLRLSEQVGRLAERLEQLPGAEAAGGHAMFRFETPGARWNGPKPDGAEARLVRGSRPALPDPRLVRRVIRHRQLRAQFFDAELFADPAWDILLDLTAARAEQKRVSVTSLCIASGVPPTTALRWIAQMTEAGLLVREEDRSDRRRAFVTLSDRAADQMARYFAELARGVERLA